MTDRVSAALCVLATAACPNDPAGAEDLAAELLKARAAALDLDPNLERGGSALHSIIGFWSMGAIVRLRREAKAGRTIVASGGHGGASAWAGVATDIGGAGAGRAGPTATAEEIVVRYQRCVSAMLDLFGTDPLPPECPAHYMVERLEALVSMKLLAPSGDVKALRNVLLRLEWDAGSDESPECPDCTGKMPTHGFRTTPDGPLLACGLDLALTRVGLPDQESRDEAREAMG